MSVRHIVNRISAGYRGGGKSGYGRRNDQRYENPMGVLIHPAGLRNCAAAMRPQTWCADGPAGLRRPGAGRGVVGLPVMMSRSFTAVGA